MSEFLPAGIIFQGACIQSGAVIALLPYYFKLFSLVIVLPFYHGQSDKGHNIFDSFYWFAHLQIMPHILRPLVFLLYRPAA
jgi:hypothetical protein